ncbi:acidic mammalian chitinase-like [Sardina pilchardus]|uniref:acidic mammalian chitinase-like n=1 Tax=Sardina pilchardus TaxID=27697 RepID=UPI002E134E59
MAVVIVNVLNLPFPHSANTLKLVCYFTNWAQYRDGPARFLPDNVDPHLCTHLMFAFAIISHGNKLVASDWNDDVLYKSFNALKTRNPKLKTLLSVKGQDTDSAKFSEMMSSSYARQQFIQSSIRLLRAYGFDGLDLAWQGPAFQGRPPEDRRRFTLLCKELVEAYEAESKASGYPRLMISAAVAAKRNVIFISYDVPQISQYLDFISVLTFGFHGSEEGLTNHHSPLYSGEHQTGESLYYNVNSAILYWKEQGAPVEKLLMGFPTFGRSFLLTSTVTGLGAPTRSSTVAGPYTQEIGLWSNYEICSFLKGATVEWIDNQRVPYAVKGRGWVGFDNQTSYYYKVQYLMEHKLGGAVVWTLDLDDFSGEFCSQGSSPLIRYLKTQLENGKTLHE